MFHFSVLAFRQFSQRSRTSSQLPIGHAMVMGRFWTALISIVIFAPCASSEQEYILAAPPWVQQEWDNSIHAKLPQMVNWDHPSVISDGNVKLLRDRYSVCNHDNSEEPNNWLLSGLIPVRESGRLDVTIEYKSQQCPTFNFCRNSFYAYVWESNASLHASHIPNPISNYTLYRKFANISRQSDNRETSTMPLQVTSEYIVLGFRDRGGCRTLYSVKVSYKVCTEKAALADSLVYLPRTFPQLASVTVEGRCAASSTQSLPGSLIVLCDSNGEWNTSQLEGRCICKKGKENIGGKCADCRPGTFNEGRGLNCTVIPSEPRNASVSFVDETSAVVTWLPPATTGYPPSTVFYDVDCRKTCEDAAGSGCGDQTCNSGIGAQLSMQGLNTTNFTATNLASFVNYTCNIKAGNRVSKIAETTSDTINTKKPLTVVTLRTEGSVPGTPEDVTVYLAEDDSINLSWTLKCKNGIIQKYVVQYFSVDDSSDIKTLTTKENESRIKNLVAGKTFEFQVYAVNNFGTGSPGVKTFHIPRGSSKNAKMPEEVTIAIVAVACLCLLLLVAVVCLWRLKQRKKETSFAPSDPDFKFDAFIIYSTVDQKWVTKKLLPTLESKHKIKCCIHYRDFVPGVPFTKNMADSVYNSKKTVAVVSKSFLTSNFCSHELSIALHRLAERGDDSVVVVKLDDVKNSQLPKELRFRSYIDFTKSTDKKTWEYKLVKCLKSGTSPSPPLLSF